jgi:hypothetical protein
MSAQETPFPHKLSRMALDVEWTLVGDALSHNNIHVAAIALVLGLQLYIIIFFRSPTVGTTLLGHRIVLNRRYLRAAIDVMRTYVAFDCELLIFPITSSNQSTLYRMSVACLCTCRHRTLCVQSVNGKVLEDCDIHR